jgi:thiosulfate dehydrogenase [quinone] large subunit
MSERNAMETELFGRPVHFEYAECSVGYSLFTLRIVLGWTLFQGRITKLVTYLDGNPETNWTAAGFLTNVPAGNSLAGVFASVAGNPAIDLLNVWRLTLTGLALRLGAFGAGRLIGLDAWLGRSSVV